MKVILKTPRRLKAIIITVFYKIFSSPKMMPKDCICLNSLETIDYIISNRVSISRFGMGEINIINKKDTLPQRYNEILAKKLIKIFEEPLENHISCVPANVVIPLKQQTCENGKKFKKKVFFYYNRHIFENKKTYRRLLTNSKLLGDANISRYYIDYKISSLESIEKYIEKFKLIWSNKDIVFVEGKFSRLGVGNDLFDNAKSIKRILGPRNDAFDEYDKLLEVILKNVTKEKLIILALGVTATVLAYDLSKCGYQALDLGNLDIEYDWFKMNAKDKISLASKDVTDGTVINGVGEKEKVEDKGYLSQIIASIE